MELQNREGERGNVTPGTEHHKQGHSKRMQDLWQHCRKEKLKN